MYKTIKYEVSVYMLFNQYNNQADLLSHQKVEANSSVMVIFILYNSFYVTFKYHELYKSVVNFIDEHLLCTKNAR